MLHCVNILFHFFHFILFAFLFTWFLRVLPTPHPHFFSILSLSRLQPIPTFFLFCDFLKLHARNKAIFFIILCCAKRFSLRACTLFLLPVSRASILIEVKREQLVLAALFAYSFVLCWGVFSVFSFLAERSPACFSCCFCVYFLSITTDWQAKLRRN